MLAEQRFGTEKLFDARMRASASLESRKLPDPYNLIIQGNKLLDPITLLSVESFLSQKTLVEKAEYDAFLNIQNWAVANKQGLAFWISPPHISRSAQAKIIISEIYSGQLINKSLLFDTTETEILEIANQIQAEFANGGCLYESADLVRRHPIFAKSDFDGKWLERIKNIISEELQWEMIEKGEDKTCLDDTMMWAMTTVGTPLAVDNRYVGTNTLSCPWNLIVSNQSAFGYFSRFGTEEKFVKNCGNCGEPINDWISAGYECKKCHGVYEGC